MPICKNKKSSPTRKRAQRVNVLTIKTKHITQKPLTIGELMGYFIGLDVSDASTNVCILDKTGVIIKKFMTATDPTSLDSVFHQLNMPIDKIGLETGPKSNWIVRELRKKGWTVVLQDSFKMAKLIETKVNKTDDNDAHLIAETTLAGSLIPGFLNMGVHLKSPESEDIRTLIRTRQAILRQNIDIYNRVRGILKAYGKAIPVANPGAFSRVVSKAIEGMSFEVQLSLSSLIQPYDANIKLIDAMDKHLSILADRDETVQRLKTIPEVGNITALYLRTTIDDPLRFTDSRSVGAYFGLSPLQYSSGEKQQQGKISKRGDEIARSLLIGAANRILRPSAKPNALKTKGQELMKRCGKGKATVAIARKLAIIIHRIMVNKKTYIEKVQYLPKNKKDPIKLTIEEIQRLASLAEKTGYVEFRSAQHIKKLTTKFDSFNQSGSVNTNKLSRRFVNKHKRHKKESVCC